MIKKVYKKVEQNNGTLVFYGSNRAAKLEYNASGSDEYFVHYGRRYYLSEFMRIDKHAPDYMQEFDGYLNDSFFSGVVIKIDNTGFETAVRAFTFIG